MMYVRLFAILLPSALVVARAGAVGSDLMLVVQRGDVESSLNFFSLQDRISGLLKGVTGLHERLLQHQQQNLQVTQGMAAMYAGHLGMTLAPELKVAKEVYVAFYEQFDCENREAVFNQIEEDMSTTTEADATVRNIHIDSEPELTTDQVKWFGQAITKLKSINKKKSFTPASNQFLQMFRSGGPNAKPIFELCLLTDCWAMLDTVIPEVMYTVKWYQTAVDNPYKHLIDQYNRELVNTANAEQIRRKYTKLWKYLECLKKNTNSKEAVQKADAYFFQNKCQLG